MDVTKLMEGVRGRSNFFQKETFSHPRLDNISLMIISLNFVKFSHFSTEKKKEGRKKQLIIEKDEN
jgi:hypothetical protein